MNTQYSNVDKEVADTTRRSLSIILLVVTIIAALSQTSCQTHTPMARGMEVATAALFGGAVNMNGTPLMAPAQPQASPAFEAFYR